MTSSDASSRQYDFGGNWWTFVDGHLTDDRIELAKQSLVDFLELDSLQGKSFLDIGCGSGLFSLSANLLGAERIASVDINPRSIYCCDELRKRAENPGHWTTHEGSVLDREFMDQLDQYDIVYSWGVLHHTGSMWEAIRNAAQKVKPGGLFYIAIYNSGDALGFHSDGRVGSAKFWEKEKLFYLNLPKWGQTVMDYSAATGMVLGYVVRLQNPVDKIKNHRNLRGMSWMVDIRDWLGGYPYEHATVGEIFRFNKQELGFELTNLTSTNSLVNNEFLFRRPLDGDRLG